MSIGLAGLLVTLLLVFGERILECPTLTGMQKSVLVGGMIVITGIAFVLAFKWQKNQEQKKP